MDRFLGVHNIHLEDVDVYKDYTGRLYIADDDLRYEWKRFHDSIAKIVFLTLDEHRKIHGIQENEAKKVTKKEIKKEIKNNKKAKKKNKYHHRQLQLIDNCVRVVMY
jgi:hypothetical protein